MRLAGAHHSFFLGELGIHSPLAMVLPLACCHALCNMSTAAPDISNLAINLFCNVGSKCGLFAYRLDGPITWQGQFFDSCDSCE